jgi:hypothetical protein
MYCNETRSIYRLLRGLKKSTRSSCNIIHPWDTSATSYVRPSPDCCRLASFLQSQVCLRRLPNARPAPGLAAVLIQSGLTEWKLIFCGRVNWQQLPPTGRTSSDSATAHTPRLIPCTSSECSRIFIALVVAGPGASRGCSSNIFNKISDRATWSSPVCGARCVGRRSGTGQHGWWQWLMEIDRNVGPDGKWHNNLP